MIAKRLFDIVFSTMGFVLLLPLYVVIAIAIVVDSGMPFIYRQTRVGLKRKCFVLYKFRTMVLGADRMGYHITTQSDPRITRMGAYLRRYKLDELPQLVNVIKGDMSLVGPRPEVPQYAKCYPEQDEIYNVKPGITDPASIVFKKENELLGETNEPEREYIEQILPIKIRHYQDYIRNISLLRDFRIIVRTIYVSLCG